MELYVLDKNFDTLAVIDRYESLIWTDRYSACGDFELYLTVEPEFLGLLKPDRYLWIRESEHTMVIETIKINADAEEGDHLVVTGRSLESILERRILWGQQSYSGNFQNGVKRMLEDCIISPYDPDRKIGNFRFEASDDPKVTELTISRQYTGDNLYDVVKDLCEENHLGFKVTLNREGEFVFRLYAGTDRSYEQAENPYVVFSPKFENILNSNYCASATDLKNVALVAGEGEGYSRTTNVAGEGKGLSRRELFVDARDISSDTEDGELPESTYLLLLRARGLERLAEHTATTAFEGEVEATRLFRYGEDFFIGDTVQVADGYGNEGSVFISEVVISHSEEGFSIYPTFETFSKEGGSAT